MLVVKNYFTPAAVVSADFFLPREEIPCIINSLLKRY
jgi:hypothetical protein